jgi:hypothetical protein
MPAGLPGRPAVPVADLELGDGAEHMRVIIAPRTTGQMWMVVAAERPNYA